MTLDKQKESSQQFIIQKFYVKDISFESPDSPKVFGKEWKPDMHLDVRTSSEALEDDNYEVVVHLMVTVKAGDKVAFLVEIKQAGIFTISGFSPSELEHTLACFCASSLYPYGREVVTDLVMKGGFPQLLLPPVNFDAIYEDRKRNSIEADLNKKH